MLKFEITRWNYEATINEPSTSIILSSKDIEEVISVLEVETQTLENRLTILVINDYGDYIIIVDDETTREFLDLNLLEKHLEALNDYNSDDMEDLK